MITVTTLLTKKAKATLALSLVMGVACTVITPVYAEEAMIAQAEQLSPDQESLLPPEVVPLDPAAASKLTQTNPSTFSIPEETASAAGTGSGNQPTGTVTPGAPQGMQSAKDFKKDMFDSLMGKGNVTPQFINPPQYPQPNFNTSQFNPQQGTRFDPAQMAQQPGAQAQSAPAQPMGQSQWMNGNGAPAVAQSQTLSGGVQQPATVSGSGKGFGVAHGVSIGTMLGMGALPLLFGRGPGRFYSGGLMGLGLMNYGVRNGFRF